MGFLGTALAVVAGLWLFGALSNWSRPKGPPPDRLLGD